MVGELPEPGSARRGASATRSRPCSPVQRGLRRARRREGWYAVWGDSGPWIAFAPIFQIAQRRCCKATVPYLSQHFRVVTMDGRGNGRSDRPRGQDAYTLRALLRRTSSPCSMPPASTALAVVGISADGDDRAAPGRRAAAAGHARHRRRRLRRVAASTIRRWRERMRAESERMRARLARLPRLVLLVRLHRAALDQAVRGRRALRLGHRAARWSTGARNGWMGNDVRELARQVSCPTLVIHGDDDRRVPYAKRRGDPRAGAGRAHAHHRRRRPPAAGARPGRRSTARCATSSAGRPRTATWTRAMAASAARCSSPARSASATCSATSPSRASCASCSRTSRSTGSPSTRPPPTSSARASGCTRSRGASPTRAATSRGGRRARPAGVLRAAHDGRDHGAQLHDLRRPDGGGALRPRDRRRSLGRRLLLPREPGTQAPAVRVPHRLRRLPADGRRGERRARAFLCADRNADDIEHVARFPYVRDAAIFVGNPEDVTEQPFGPGLPGIRDWTDRNFAYSGYALPFDPAGLRRHANGCAQRHGYRSDEKIVIAAVGGTGVGTPLLERIAQAFPLMKRQVPELRMILVAGPRLAARSLSARRRARGAALRAQPVRAPGLLRPRARAGRAEHLHGAGRDAPAVPELPAAAALRADASTCASGSPTTAPTARWTTARSPRRRWPTGRSPAMHAPVRYRPVETDGAARAARRIAQVMDNRWWTQQ